MEYDIYNAISEDYSKFINRIPNQLGWSIEHGNRVFEILKKKEMKRVSKKYNISMDELNEHPVFK